MTEKEERHIYIEQMITPISRRTGLSKAVVKRVVTAFCKEVGQALSEGQEVTLRDLGRFRTATVKSYWKKDLRGNRRVQKKYRRIYFSASKNVTKKLNKILHADTKNKLEQ